LAFNGNAPFPLDVHIIEELVTEFPITYHFADLDKSVGKGGFSMINMGDYAEVPDVIHICYLIIIPGPSAKKLNEFPYIAMQGRGNISVMQ
jgi:hypothetical protein